MKDSYITAILTLLSQGTAAPADVFSRLEKVLAARGHSRMFGGIVRGVERQLATLEKTLTPTLVVARATDATHPAVAGLLTALAATDAPRVVVDDTIVGGHILRFRNREVNRSYKHALVTLYQHITT